MLPPMRTTRTAHNSISPSLQLKDVVLSISQDPRPQKRKRLSKEQTICLETLFKQTTHPTAEEKLAVANKIGIHINTVTYWFQNKRQTAKKTGACSNPQDASSNISSSGVVNALHSHNAGCQSEGEHCLSSRRAPLKALCVSSSTSSRLSYKGPIARDTTAYTTSMFSHGPPLLAVPIKIEPDHTLIDRDSLTEPRPEISRAGKYRTHQEPRCNPKKRTLEWACEQQIKRMKRTAQGFRLMRDTRGEDKNELRRVFPNPGLYVLAPNHSKHPIESALSLLALSGRPLTHADIGPDLVFCASVLLDLKYSRTNESDALT